MQDPTHAQLLVDAALTVHGHGFASQFGSMDGPVGWHGLTEVSPVILDNLGEHDLAAQFRKELGDAPHTAWVHTNDAGDDQLVATAPVGSDRERHLIRVYEMLEKGVSD